MTYVVVDCSSLTTNGKMINTHPDELLLLASNIYDLLPRMLICSRLGICLMRVCIRLDLSALCIGVRDF